MQDLKVVIVQPDVIWERPDKNLAHLEQLVQNQSADLIVLPEMFSTGFSMKAKELAEPMDGQTVFWLKRIAKTRQSVVTGSVIITAGGQFYNRLLWVTPDGTIEHYDKRHLIGLMGETEQYSPGRERKILKLNGWRVCPQICYDLRFPVWCRNQDDYDLLLFVANWPSPRHTAWTTLLHARAIENQCYLIGVNRVGKDENGYQFNGGSRVVDPLGNAVSELQAEEGIITATLLSDELVSLRMKLPFLRDRDSFSIKI